MSVNFGSGTLDVWRGRSAGITTQRPRDRLHDGVLGRVAEDADGDPLPLVAGAAQVHDNLGVTAAFGALRDAGHVDRYGFAADGLVRYAKDVGDIHQHVGLAPIVMRF